MKSLNIALFGCGTVGGGVAKIFSELGEELNERAGIQINLKKIVSLGVQDAIERFNLDADLFAGGGKDITPEESNAYIAEVLASNEYDLVIETIGGTSDFVYNLCLNVVNSGKHLVTANKALLAERGVEIFNAAEAKGVKVGFEAAVCGAIPIIKTIKESLTGDVVTSVSGIMNGTSNYILSQMQNGSLDFATALKMAQEAGYAEADPSLDVNGGDAGHKIVLLIKLAFGIDVPFENLSITGIENITKEDIDFANEIDAKVKLICYAKRINGDIYATVQPMMVKNSSILSNVNNATNAVRVNTKYSGIHILVGEGAGSSETAMSIVSDIVFIARYNETTKSLVAKKEAKFADVDKFVFPYLLTFHTADKPGTTGFITSAIGKQNINIDTVSHNRHSNSNAVFSVATMPSTVHQIEAAIANIKTERPDLLLSETKIMPILF